MDTKALAGSPVVLDSSRTVVALCTWGLAFCVLLIGGGIGAGFTSTLSGDGSEAGAGRVVSALLAGALWAIACWVAMSDLAARRTMGLLHAGQVVALVAGGYLGEFVFVWRSDSGWMAALEVVLAITALALLAPAPSTLGHSSSKEVSRPGARRFSVEGRALLWTFMGVICSMTGYNVGQQVDRPVLGTAMGVVAGFVLYLFARGIRVVRARRGRAASGVVPAPRQAADQQGLGARADVDVRVRRVR